MRVFWTPCCRSLLHTHTRILSLALSRWAHPPHPLFLHFSSSVWLARFLGLSLSVSPSLSLTRVPPCLLPLLLYIHLLVKCAYVDACETPVNELAFACCAAVGLRSPGQHGWAHHYGPQNGASMRFSLLLSACAYTSVCMCIYIRTCTYKCAYTYAYAHTNAYSTHKKHLQRYREREIHIFTYMHTSTYAYLCIILRID